MTSDDLETRLALVIESHVLHGRMPVIAEVTADRPELAAPLAALVRRYLDLSQTLDAGADLSGDGTPAGSSAPATIAIDGFRTIERLGMGGMGEVYKLQDLTLDRVVAAKVVRAGGPAATRLGDFLREARSLALFSDPRVVRIFEFRDKADPPVIIMEHVEGFELGRIGPSLEFRQRARILRDVCDVIQHAHTLGIQHRDLKPSNIMLDGRLEPKILDFGLSTGDPAAGHLRGTPAYIAPEQLDPNEPIDARTDVYALGVVLYELLSGVVPYSGPSTGEMLDAIRRGQPPLPVEINPQVPEPLQAIALKAMEARPADRYQSAREMSLDLGRYLDGLPVVARPTQYASTLQARVRPHLEQIGEWQRLRLIYPHEAARLRSVYGQLDAREDDWIVASRVLSSSQIALYLGAFLLFAGSLFYFVAHRVYEAADGLVEPLVVLGIPFIGLNVAGRWLYRRHHEAVAVAFYLAGVTVLPLFLLIVLHEANFWVVESGTPGQFFTDGFVSNRQLQVTIGLSAAWAGWLALRTTTGALSTVFTLLVFLLSLAVLTDRGLADWLDEETYDRLALHLAPVVALYAAVGVTLERTGRSWFATPLYVAGVATLVLVLDLLALDGRMWHYAGISLQHLQSDEVSSETLIDSLSAMTFNGMLFYVVALAVERRGTTVMSPAAHLLFLIAPFSMLEPLAWLSGTAEYSLRFDWLYLALAVTVAIVSRERQRKSFYYAGVINTGFALYFIADHNQWFDRPVWALAVVAAGLAALLAGFAFDRRRRPTPS